MCFQKPIMMWLFETHVASRRKKPRYENPHRVTTRNNPLRHTPLGYILES